MQTYDATFRMRNQYNGICERLCEHLGSGSEIETIDSHVYMGVMQLSAAVMVKPAPKKPRRSLPPDIESLEALRSTEKQAIEAVKSGYEDIKQPPNLELANVKRLEKVNDEVLLLCLMARYGVIAVVKVMAAMKSIPASLTENQAQKYVCPKSRFPEVM